MSADAVSVCDHCGVDVVLATPRNHGAEENWGAWLHLSPSGATYWYCLDQGIYEFKQATVNGSEWAESGPDDLTQSVPHEGVVA